MLRPALLSFVLAASSLAQDLLPKPVVLRPDGKWCDFPATCTDGDGTPWVAYVQWDGVEDSLHVAKLKGDVLVDVLTMNGPGIIHQPSMVRDGAGTLHVFWSQVNGKNLMELKHAAVPYENTPPSMDAFTLASSPKGGNAFAKSAVDTAGNVWVVWHSLPLILV